MDKYTDQPSSARMHAAPRRPNAPYAAVQATGVPSHDDIARRAYEIYHQNGCRQGQSAQNWRQAEVDLRNESLAAR